jgi:mannose-1-phosphate guanylyltransferase
LFSSVKAVILVGGQGTRLRPLTCNTPKSMVPVLNIPFLEHVILNLKAHDVTDIILAQHHLAASMAQYFGDGARFGVHLTYVMEDTPRGTAGAVKNVECYLDSTFFVLNGDTFHNRDFVKMLAFHRRHKAKATIELTPVEDPSVYGVVETDNRGRVKRFIEKPKREEATTNMINAGTYVLEPEVLQRIPPDIKCSFEREIFPGLIRDGKPVYAYPSHRYWMDTGTPEKYLQLHRDLLGGKCEGYIFDRDVIKGKHCQIHPTAKLSGGVVLGDNCVVGESAKLTGPLVLGSHCRIGRETVIEDCVLWDNVTVGAHAELRSSVIANDCSIGRTTHLRDTVLGDHIALPAGSTPEPGTRIFPEGMSGNT